jgi:hypothetical protein
MARADAIYELQSAFAQFVADAEGKKCRMTDALGSDVQFVMGKPTGRKPRQATKPGASYSLPGSVVMYPYLGEFDECSTRALTSSCWIGPCAAPVAASTGTSSTSRTGSILQPVIAGIASWKTFG